MSAQSTATSRRLNVVITGGSGALASHIARLIYAQWQDVQEIRLFDLVPPQQAYLTSITGYTTGSNDPKVSYYFGDMMDCDTLIAAFAKADVVIHCAGVVDNGGVMTRRRMSINPAGAKNVIRACLDCGVAALVFSGSLAQVFAAAPLGGSVQYEELMELPVRARLLFPHYGESKAAAEKLVLLANASIGTGGTVLYTCSLRMPPMFGENDQALVPAATRMARACCGCFVPPNSSAKMQSLYFGNAAWAHVLAAQKLLDEKRKLVVGGKFYYVGDHTPACSMAEFHAQFLIPLGYRVSRIRVPLFLLTLLAFLVELLSLVLAWFKIDWCANLTGASVRYLKLNHTILWQKARVELGYEPLFPHSTALARSLSYYRHAV